MGRKTHVVHNLSTSTKRQRTGRDTRWPDSLVADIDRTRELETENALLRARVAELKSRLDDLAAERSELTQILEGEDGATDEAFVAFLSTPDPHLDKVRRFLLD